MSDPLWLSYVGAITGITGSVLGLIAYKRSNELKSLDLRLELRKNLNTLHADANELLPFMEHTKKSRYAVSSATGRLKSGPLQKWDADYESDKTFITALINDIPSLDNTYIDLSHLSLESKIIEVHSLQDKVSRLRQKFNEFLAEDDRARVQIAANNMRPITSRS